MGGKSSKPSFFWQGIMILLPVLVLALASLASLRWDEQSAERDARKKAAESVQSLAQVIRYSVADELQRFLTLQNVWTMELASASQPSVTANPDQKLQADIARWEQDYPGFKLADWATSPGLIMDDGRLIDPPERPVAPSPPKWFRELSSKQQQLWQALGEKLTDEKEFRKAYDAFVDSGVPTDGRQAAANLEQRLKFHNFSYGVPLTPTEYSEAGISFRGIALAQMLSNPALSLSNCVQQPFWSEVIEEPSFIAPMLLEMAEAKTNRADAVTFEKLHLTRELWAVQLKKQEWLESIRPLTLPKVNQPSSTNWACWTSGADGEALALAQPSTFQNMGGDAEGVPLSGEGYRIWFFPRPIVEAMVKRSLAKNSFLIPNFAEAILTVEGRTLVVSSGRTARSGPELLGTANGRFGAAAAFPAAAAFEIKFVLVSRSQMLKTERRRAWMVGLLICGAAGAALIGYASARGAFRTQLHLNEAKSNFVSSVSHELRAPIASVRLMAESLERGKVTESAKQNEYYRFIVQECRRLSSLIENVLDFSRIEQGRKQYEFEPTDALALTRETVKLMEPYAEERGVQLKLETSNIQHPTSNIELEIDGRAIQQALVNLIDNAIKHSAKGQTVTVGLNAGCKTGVLVYVEDHGPGIPPVEHEKIFERFYRLGSELRRETQGVGIGLSIVRHIVVAHGGNVTVRSNVGEGSRFTIVLPVIASHR
jgi:signal transduction histidine kinase